MGSGGDFIGRLTPNFGGGGFMGIVVPILIGTVILFFCGLFIWWMVKRRIAWNLKVEFRLPRNLQIQTDEDGNEKLVGTINKEWGKGYYNAKQGVVFVKRKKKTAIPMKPFNIKEFLSGNNILTVIQVGIEDYRPVLEDSYLEVEDYDTGEKGALIKTKIDTSESKAWRNSYERERKSTYTIMGWLHEHGQLLGFGFILISIFVGFAIVYGKIA